MQATSSLPPTWWIKTGEAVRNKKIATLATTVEKAREAYVKALVVRKDAIKTNVELHFQYSTSFQPEHVYQLDCCWQTRPFMSRHFELTCSVVDVTWCLPVDILDILRPPVASELQRVYTELLQGCIRSTERSDVKARLEAMLHFVGCLTSDRHMQDVVVDEIVQKTYNKQSSAFRYKCQRIFNSSPGHLKTPDEKQQLTAVLKKHLADHSDAVVKTLLQVCLKEILTSTAASTDTPVLTDTITEKLTEMIVSTVSRQKLGQKCIDLFNDLISSTSV